MALTLAWFRLRELDQAWSLAAARGESAGSIAAITEIWHRPGRCAGKRSAEGFLPLRTQ
jgi:hypothetical protein